MKRIGQAIEWLGFDFMIDVQFKVWLIEVNISPDVSHSTALTAKLVPPASEAALQGTYCCLFFCFLSNFI